MKGILVMPGDTVTTRKARELLDYAKKRYGDELSEEAKSYGSTAVMHHLMLNGVQICLVMSNHTLGTHTHGDLLYEAGGACARVLNKKGFLVFGGRDLSGRLVDPFFVKKSKDGMIMQIVGEERVERVEALFRMLLVLAMGW